MFEIGDKVKIQFKGYNNPHYGKIGTVTWLHNYNHYPNGDFSIIEEKTQGTITFDDGSKEDISNMEECEKIEL